MTYLIPALILGVCGLLAGVLLTVAAKVFYVKVDERVSQISESLPQANCGACGFAGCADYADAIVNSGAPTTSAVPEALRLQRKLPVFSELPQRR